MVRCIWALRRRPTSSTAACWNNNYYYITELELEMRRFLNNGDFASFTYHGEQFRAALESVV
jgi:hypothetical protein